MRHVFLIGYMGSGKTTLGRMLAQEIAMPFLDLDHILEKETHRSIADIIRTDGELVFREREREVLHRVLSAEPGVVACGGGTPCFSDNMDRMRKAGIVVYLKLPPALLANRLRDEMAARPLLDGASSTSLEDFIRGHLAERETFYREAHIIWDPEKGDIRELKHLIKSL